MVAFAAGAGAYVSLPPLRVSQGRRLAGGLLDRRVLGVAKRRRHDFEIGILVDGQPDHFLEVGHVEIGKMLIHPLNLESERGGEILLVADHHVDHGRQVSIDLLRPGGPADPLP